MALAADGRGWLGVYEDCRYYPETDRYSRVASVSIAVCTLLGKVKQVLNRVLHA